MLNNKYQGKVMCVTLVNEKLSSTLPRCVAKLTPVIDIQVMLTGVLIHNVLAWFRSDRKTFGIDYTSILHSDFGGKMVGAVSMISSLTLFDSPGSLFNVGVCILQYHIHERHQLPRIAEFL